MKSLLRTPLFWLGMLPRFLLLFGVGSTYLKDLFIPFLDQSVLHLGENPWVISPPHFFPYGSVLFLLLFVPKYLGYLVAGTAALGLSSLSFFLIKFPLLIVDVLFLRVLQKFAPTQSQKILIFFWLNPVLFYITYIHGQLDIVAMYFCFLTLFMLIRNRIEWAAVCFSTALLCKFHVAILAPFLAAYIWNRNFFSVAAKKISITVLLTTSLFVLGSIPLVLAKRIDYATLSSPQAVGLFAAQLNFGNGQVLLLGLSLVLLVLLRLCLSTTMTPKGLVYGSGLIFTSLLLATSPAPGWFFWSVPFFALFLAEFENIPKLPAVSFALVYLLYFGAYWTGTTPNDSLLNQILFSVLQTHVLGLVIFWFLFLKAYLPLAGRLRPLLLGIAGDSGAGKNYLTQTIRGLFHETFSRVMEGDDYHRWERGHFKWEQYTHLNPKANHLFALAQHTRLLLGGQSIEQPHYDHDTGLFSAPQILRPTKTIIVQGLHSLYLKEMRKQFDLRVYLDPDPRLRLFWKAKRDMEQRGATADAVRKALEKRQTDSKLHIEPQKQFADWIIQIFPVGNFDDQWPLDKPLPTLATRHFFWNDAPVADLANALSALPGCEVQLAICSDDFSRLQMDFFGNPTAEEIQKIADGFFDNLRQITRGRTPPQWKAGQDGVNQLIAVSLLAGMKGLAHG